MEKTRKTREGVIQMTEVGKSLMETKQGEKVRLFLLYLVFIFVSSLIFGVEMDLHPYFFLGRLFVYHLLFAW